MIYLMFSCFTGITAQEMVVKATYEDDKDNEFSEKAFWFFFF